MHPRPSEVAAIVVCLTLSISVGCDKPKEPSEAVEDKRDAVPLPSASPVELDTAELAAMFAAESKNTDLQRETKEKELQGTVVEWKGLDVHDVDASGDDCFKIQTSPTTTHPGTLIEACKSVDPQIAELATALQTDDFIDVKGTIHGVSMRNIELQPAIVSRSDAVDDVTLVCRKMAELVEKEDDLPEEAKAEAADLEKCKLEAAKEKAKDPEKFAAMAKCVTDSDDMTAFMKCAMAQDASAG